jgi:hypothetical protein
MTVVELFEDAVQLAAQPSVDAHSEDVGYLVGGEADESHFAGALENLVHGEVPFENEVPAILDLIGRVVTADMDRLPVLFGELGAPAAASGSSIVFR